MEVVCTQKKRLSRLTAAEIFLKNLLLPFLEIRSEKTSSVGILYIEAPTVLVAVPVELVAAPVGAARLTKFSSLEFYRVDRK